LRIGAIQNGKIIEAIPLAPMKPPYLIDHNISFFHIAVRIEHRHRFSLLLFREHLFPYLLPVLLYQAVGRTNDGLCGTIVLLQFEQSRSFVQLGKLQDIIDIGSTEGIDALRVISHHTHLLMDTGQLLHNAMLRIIGILILIHQYIFELTGILLTDFRITVKQQIGIYQQIIKVHHITLPAPVPIPAVDFVRSRHLCLHIALTDSTVSSIRIGKNQPVLGATDAVLDSTGLVSLVIQLHFLNDRLDQTL